VYISHDVVFHENLFPFASLHPTTGARYSAEVLLLPSHSSFRATSDSCMNNTPVNSCVPNLLVWTNQHSQPQTILTASPVQIHNVNLEEDLVLDPASGRRSSPCTSRNDRGLYNKFSSTRGHTGNLIFAYPRLLGTGGYIVSQSRVSSASRCGLQRPPASRVRQDLPRLTSPQGGFCTSTCCLRGQSIYVGFYPDHCYTHTTPIKHQKAKNIFRWRN
jgi:hypothetical protein